MIESKSGRRGVGKFFYKLIVRRRCDYSVLESTPSSITLSLKHFSSITKTHYNHSYIYHAEKNLSWKNS